MNELTRNKITVKSGDANRAGWYKKNPFLFEERDLYQKNILINIVQCNSIIAAENRTTIGTGHHP